MRKVLKLIGLVFVTGLIILLCEEQTKQFKVADYI